MKEYKEKMKKFIKSMERANKTTKAYYAHLRGEITAEEYEKINNKEFERLYEEALQN